MPLTGNVHFCTGRAAVTNVMAPNVPECDVYRLMIFPHLISHGSFRSLAACCAFACAVLVGCAKERAPEGVKGTSEPEPRAGTAAHGSYRSVDVPNGGAITGRVLFAGKRPALPAFDITSDPDACAAASRNNRLELGPRGGIRWAVVYLEGITAGKPFAEGARNNLVVDQSGCQYSPHVLVAPVGALVTFLNSDDIAHNVRVEHPASDSLLLNRTQPGRGRSDRLLVDRLGPATVGCDYHPWMNAYVFGVASPYASVTDAGGGFTIDRIPPGAYTLRLWVSGFTTTPRRDNQGRTVGYGFGPDHTQEKQVTLKAGESLSVDFEVSP